MKLDYTWETIEARRDRIHRRAPGLAVRTKKQAQRFVDSVGFCFLFQSENSELPCLWNAVCGMRDAVPPKRSQRDPYFSLRSDLKSILPDGRRVYYGKILQGRLTVISLEFLPYFFALSPRLGKRDEYIDEFKHGRLTPAAKEIMDALQDTSPQGTKGLKLAVGCSARHWNAGFEKAIGELQSKMFIANVTREYDPSTFEWEPVHKCFSQQLKRVRKITADEARIQILGKYFENQIVSSVRAVHHVFGWKKQLIFKTLGSLINRGKILPNVKVDGKDSIFYAHIR